MRRPTDAIRRTALKTVLDRTPACVYGLFPAVCCLLTGLSDRLYTDIDSFLISATLAGLYGTDSFCPSTHPLLSFVLGPFFRLWPGADWFSFFNRLFTVVGVWWLGTLLAHCLPGLARRLTTVLALGALLLQISLFNLNFTVYCGFFCFLGTLTALLALDRPLPRGAAVLCPVFFCLAVLLRPAGALLFLPFAALALGALAVTHQLPKRKPRRACLWGALAVVALLAALPVFYCLQPDQALARDYNDTRGLLVDYPQKPWEEVCDALAPLSVSENDYTLYTTGVLLDTDRSTLETLQKVSSVSKTTAYPLTLPGIGQVFAALPGVFSTPLLGLLGAVCLLLLCAVLLARVPWPAKLEALLALAGSVGICFYYQYIGRLPERVAACVLLAFLAVLLPLCLRIPPRDHPLLQKGWGVACLFLCGAVCLCLWQNRYHYRLTQPALQAGADETTAAQNLLADETDPDAIYLWHTMTLSLYMTDHYMEEGKLPPTAFTHHHLAWSEWNTSGQIGYTQLLEELQISNPMQSLLTRPHTYLVGANVSGIETWLREHYDPHAVLRQVGSVEVFALGEVPIWQAVTRPNAA